MIRFRWTEIYCTLPPGVFPLNTPRPTRGQTYVMYHGTTRQNAQNILAYGFYRSADGMLGPGIYLSRDLEKASRYPTGHPEWDKVVIKVQVNVGKVKRIDYQYHPLQKTWHQYGYDTAWVPRNCGMTTSGQEEDCVWDPRRVTVLGVINPTPYPAQYSCAGFNPFYM